MEYISIILYLIAGIAGIILFWCLYKIGTEKQKQLTPSEKRQQYEKGNFAGGWLIALLPIIVWIVQIFIELPTTVPYDAIACTVDRENLKKQEVWKHGKIAWGWCLLSPVYMYKRTKLLKESMVKFWILIAQYCLMVATLMLAIFFDGSIL